MAGVTEPHCIPLVGQHQHLERAGGHTLAAAIAGGGIYHPITVTCSTSRRPILPSGGVDERDGSPWASGRAGRPPTLMADAHLVLGTERIHDDAQARVHRIDPPLVYQRTGHHARLAPLAALGIGSQAARRPRSVGHAIPLPAIG